MTLYAGAARVCITPPIGVELAGYGPFWGRRSQSVHDDLYASALVFQARDKRVALVAADLISFDATIVDQIRQLAARETGILPTDILISCTHVHTAPTTHFLRGWGERDFEYISVLIRQIVGAIVAANCSRRPARVGSAAGDHTALPWNRTRTADHVDTSVQVLRVDADGHGPDNTIALLVNYACHPVMLGPSTAISADYPGALRGYIESTFPGAVVLFMNGACGDIDPISNKHVWGRATFADVDAAGRELAGEAVRIAQSIQPSDVDAVEVTNAYVDLPYREMSEEDVEQEAATRIEHFRSGVAKHPDAKARAEMFWRTWSSDVLEAKRSGAAKSCVRIELQAFHIGEVVLLAIPAELYAEVGLKIKAGSGYSQTFIATCANGNVGYIATEQDFLAQAYASSMAFAVYGHFPFLTEVAAILCDAAVQLIRTEAQRRVV